MKVRKLVAALAVGGALAVTGAVASPGLADVKANAVDAEAGGPCIRIWWFQDKCTPLW